MPGNDHSKLYPFFGNCLGRCQVYQTIFTSPSKVHSMNPSSPATKIKKKTCTGSWAPTLLVNLFDCNLADCCQIGCEILKLKVEELRWMNKHKLADTMGRYHGPIPWADAVWKIYANLICVCQIKTHHKNNHIYCWGPLIINQC